MQNQSIKDLNFKIISKSIKMLQVLHMIIYIIIHIEDKIMIFFKVKNILIKLKTVIFFTNHILKSASGLILISKSLFF